MNPIVIVVLVGAVGYGVYRFISRPTIDIETKPDSELEKGMEKVDKAIGQGAVFIGQLANAADFVISRLSGEKTRSSASVLFERIWKNRASDKIIFDYYKYLFLNAPRYYFGFLTVPFTKRTKHLPEPTIPKFGWNPKVITAEKSIFEFLEGNSHRELIDDTGKIVGSKASFTFGHGNASRLTQFKWKDMKVSGDVEIQSTSSIKYSTVLNALNPGINTFSVFYGMPFVKPWLGANPNTAYYLITLFPGHSRTYGIFATLDSTKTKIVSIVQHKIEPTNQNVHMKIGRLAMFAQLDKIYSGFYNKLAIYNSTYTGSLT